MATVTETPEQALARIRSMGFCQNDALVIMHFDACGIAADDIDPKHNVLTFNAWKGAGRRVAKGATGCPVTVWIPKRGKTGVSDDSTDEKKAASGMYPKTSRVFHISQTIPEGADSLKVAKDGTVKGWPTAEGIPDAWNNPALVKETERLLYAQARAKLEPWTQETTLEQVDAEMREVLTGKPAPVKEFSGPTIGELVPPEDEPKDDFGAMGDDRPQTCNCPMVGCVTNADCPIHGDKVLQTA